MLRILGISVAKTVLISHVHTRTDSDRLVCQGGHHSVNANTSVTTPSMAIGRASTPW